MNLRSEALKRATLMLAAVGYEYRIELKGEVVADTLPKANKRDMNRFALYRDEILDAINSPEGTVGNIFIKPEADATMDQVRANLQARCIEKNGKGSMITVGNKDTGCIEWMRTPPKHSEE